MEGDIKKELKKYRIINDNFYEKNFNDLSLTVLHDIFALRSKIFVVEQNCVYQDIDGKDKDAIHAIGVEKEKVIAYARILNSNLSNPKFVSIGRITILKKKEEKGMATNLSNFVLELLIKDGQQKKLKSLHKHIKEFYESHGFIKKGGEYLEDGIPHIEMNI